MSTNNAFTPADRARALARAHRITVATGAGGLAAVMTFAGLAAVSHPGKQTTAAVTDSTTQTTTNTSDDTTSQTTDDGFAAPAQPPTNASGGGQTSTGGS